MVKKKTELDTSDSLWVALAFTVLIAALFGLVGYTGTRRWAVVGMGVTGPISTIWAFYILGWLRAPTRIGGPVRFAITLCGSGVIFAGLASKVWPPLEGMPNEGFRVRFRSNYVNPSHDANASYYYGYVFYLSNFDVLSPAALMSYIDIESLYPNDVTIETYSMTIETRKCGKTTLSDLRPETGSYLLMGPPGQNAPALIVDPKIVMESQLASPLKPNVPIRGPFFFASLNDCPVKAGEHMRLQLDLTDSFGKTSSFDSGDLVISSGEDAESHTITEPHKASLVYVGALTNPDQLIKDTVFRDHDAADNSKYIGTSQALIESYRLPQTIMFSDGTYLGVRVPKANP